MSVAPPRAVIVTVGDELLLGRTVDTNAARLGEALAALGTPVRERATVGDDDQAIREAVGRALDRAEVVLVTGGLGPTEDDRTRPAVAGLLGAALRLDPALEESLEHRFRERGLPGMPPANRSQCLVPEGARVLPNARGTAPGLAMTTDRGRVVILLPGPPRELDVVLPHAEDLLRERFGPRLRPVHHRTLHTTGVPESVLAPRVEEALGEGREVSAAFLPDLTGVDIRLTVTDAESPAEAARRLDEAEEILAPVLGRDRFAAPQGNLVEAVAEAMERRGLTVAVAESCTGGLVSRRLTDLPGSSAWFLGGVVAYSNRAKEELVGVDPGRIVDHGAVSAEVAVALAEGARDRFHADIGLGITGIAGPGGGTEEKPVGTVWIAVATDAGTGARPVVLPGDREAVRVRAAQAGLAFLRGRVEGWW